MSTKAKILPNYTYDDYRHWQDNWELIDGIPYAMRPSASPKHQLVASNLNSLFFIELDQKACACKVYHPVDIKITDNTILVPDVIICCHPIDKQFLDFPPELVVEILSPSTHLKDRNTKYELYQEFGIKYYLIVDPNKNTVEIYCLDKKGKYQLQEESRFELNDDCAIVMDFSKIWA